NPAAAITNTPNNFTGTSNTFSAGPIYGNLTGNATTAGTANLVKTNLPYSLWVDTNGNDSTAIKGSALFPFATLPAAMSNTVFGTTIYLNQGAWAMTNSLVVSN